MGPDQRQCSPSPGSSSVNTSSTSSTGSSKSSKSAVLLTLWLIAVGQLVYVNIKHVADNQAATSVTLGEQRAAESQARRSWASQQPRRLPAEGGARHLGLVLFAEAKKKKKEKSEVVVISVQNSPAKGHGMYPVYIPSCGSHGHGYGRRKRRSISYA